HVDDFRAAYLAGDVDEVYRDGFLPRTAGEFPGRGIRKAASVGALASYRTCDNGLWLRPVCLALADCPCIYRVRSRRRHGVADTAQARGASYFRSGVQTRSRGGGAIHA